MTAPDDASLEELLAFLRDSRSLDFTGYKRPSLTRRIRKRMETVEIDSFADYRDHLEVHPEEYRHLVETILINVTGFFRDQPAWDYLQQEVLPAVIKAKRPGEAIRVWSAGCASGEEAYSLAIVLAELLDTDEFKARVKIYATDVDDAALAQGRAAIYHRHQLEPLSAERLQRFFDPVADGFAIRSDYRRSVIFGRHDLTHDAPISRLDLLVCRNVLMYFLRDTQGRILRRFHYALSDGGYLFLGKAETIFAHAELFTPRSTPFRLFQRANGRLPASQLFLSPPTGTVVDHGRGQLGELAMAASPVAQLAVDAEGSVVSANTRAQALFDLGPDDVGRAIGDLGVGPDGPDLTPLVRQALGGGPPASLPILPRPTPTGDTQFLEVTVAPLVDQTGIVMGASIAFTDVTELHRTRQELEQSSSELRASNEELHSANEELETSNEELQSTNEELETTNEELQSTNEELETMNEELQSANEQLEAMNSELLVSAARIEQGERLLERILNTLRVGVAVVDQSLDVVMWNRPAEDLFGLRADEAVGRSFLALDISLPVGEVGPLLHSIVRDHHQAPLQIVLDAVNRRGQPIRCQVTADVLTTDQGGGRSILVSIEQVAPLDDGR